MWVRRAQDGLNLHDLDFHACAVAVDVPQLDGSQLVAAGGQLTRTCDAESTPQPAWPQPRLVQVDAPA
jgi:hypothetical protein